MSTPTTPPHLRFWLGHRQINLPPPLFAQGLMKSFIPATPALLFSQGLQWYAPVILPFEKPLGMADELALLVYEDAVAYKAAQASWTGQMYSAAHASLFDFSNQASTSLTHDGWDTPSRQEKLSVLQIGTWPTTSNHWALPTMGPDHVAMAALQLGPTPHGIDLQNAVQQALDSALHAASQSANPQGSLAIPPVRLYMVWQKNPASHPQAGPNLYLWCLSALGHHWARDTLHQVLQHALPAAYAPNPLSTPIWLWQAPVFEAAQAPQDGHAKDPKLSGPAWGKGWVFARPPAEAPDTNPSSAASNTSDHTL